MSEQLEMDIRIDGQGNAVAFIKNLRAELKALGRDLKTSLGSLSSVAESATGGLRQTAGSIRGSGGRSTPRDGTSAAKAIRREEQARWTIGVRELKGRMAMERTAAREAERAALTADRAKAVLDRSALTSSRAAAAFASRMNRQRASEEKAAAQDQVRSIARVEREEADSLRRRIAGDNWRFALRSRMQRQAERDRDQGRDELVRRGRNAGRYGRHAVRDVTRPSAAAAVAAGAGTAALVRKSLRAEGDIDSAEVNARIYGGLSKDSARKLRDEWAAPLAEELGIGTDKLITSYVDALKIGIPNEGAKQFSGLATKTSEAWGLSFETVTDTLGTVNSILTSTGEAFNFDKIKSVANTLQYLSAKQSTTPEKMISFLQRGAGASQVLGMSQEAGLAFGSASTSLGNQAGQSGRLFDYVASRLVEMPRLVKKHGQDGKDARDLIRDLGYGSAQAMDAQRRSAPDDFLPDFMRRFNKISDPKRQDKALRMFAGREWFGEFGRMVKGVDTYREAAKLSNESRGLDAISDVWELHKTKLTFVFKQFRSGWTNILGEFGKVLSPIARQAGDFFLSWTRELRAGGLSARFRAAVEGFLNGLGFRDLPAMLESVLDKSGEGSAGSIEAWRATFREFGAGIRDVLASIKGVVGAFTGGSPEIIARFTGRILTFSAALVVLSPVLSIIGGIATALLALGSTAATVWAGLKVAGLVGGAGATGLLSASVLTAAGGIIGAAFLAAIANKLGILQAPDFSKGTGDAILRFLDPGLADRVYGRDPTKDTAPGKALEGAGDGVKLRRAIEGNTAVQKQSYIETGGIDRSLIHRASSSAEVVDELRRAFRSDGARVQLAALTTGGSAAQFRDGGSSGAGSSGVAGLLGSRPGQALGGGTLGRRGIIGGSGAGGGNGSGMVDPSTGAGTGPYKPILDFIAQSEGTAKAAGGGYNTSLGYGRFLPGGEEQTLTGKSLNEILALGDHMRRQPGNPNSSALGRYQIVGTTLREQMRKLGLKGTDKFSEATQDRIGANLVRQRGANGSLGQEWASLTGGKLAQAVELARGIPRDASITPGERPSASAPSPSDASDVAGRIRALKDSGAISGQQCVALAKAYVGASGSVTGWQKGDAADAGTLKPGTPIATFLNRDGSQSSRYAGGGTGTPGAGLDHAGVFQSYVRDKDGKTIGMRIAEQFKGSGGPRFKDYSFGQGFGERNGSNYNAILGPDGRYLGGDRNPMTADTLANTVKENATGRVADARSGGGGGKSMSVSAPITINGTTNPEVIANRAAKHIQDSTLWRTHDLDHASI